MEYEISFAIISDIYIVR